METRLNVQSRWSVAACVLGAAFFWAYWPTLRALAEAWNHVPDYSHGYLVAPLALFFLWVRRDRRPLPSVEFGWPGLLLLALSVVLRYLSARYYLEALDGWSIIPWIAGVIWLFFGRAYAWWCLPSIAFLFFMVPLPFRAEQALSRPLQSIATKFSCFLLQLLGQPALAEGNVIQLGDIPLNVEQACSGLRIFMGMIALAFAYVVIVRRTWWEKAVLILSVVPIALIANATRIVATGLLWQYVSGEAAKTFSHDMAGLATILYAAALFALVLWYLSKLIVDVEPLEMKSVVREEGM